MSEIVTCPTCTCPTYNLFDWKFSGFESSIFNYTALFNQCGNCGLLFISNISDEVLSKFYSLECDYFQKNHFSIESSENIFKFNHYFNILKNNCIETGRMADIGCGRGGFVNWLSNNGWIGYCWGVDVDLKSLPNTDSIKSKNLSFREGDAFNLPFEEGKLDLITFFHVFEHIRDLRKIILEALRVVKDDGHILIEVPDAERYEDHPIGNSFWLSIREHVNHFSVLSLVTILESNGFQTVSINRSVLPTPEFSYPSLIIVAKKSSVIIVNKNIEQKNLVNYALDSKKRVSNIVEKINNIKSKITFWGFSSELFSILPLITHSNYSICDISPEKQLLTYRDHSIESPEVVPIEGILIIVPYLHADAIKNNAKQLGWQDSSIQTL